MGNRITLKLIGQILFIICILIGSFFSADAQTFTSRTSAQDVQVLDVRGLDHVKVFTSKGSQIRFELTVSLSCERNETSFGETSKAQKLTKTLAEAGRYRFKMLEDAGRLEVSIPGINHVLYSKTLGNIEEELELRVYVPKGVKVLQ